MTYGKGLWEVVSVTAEQILELTFPFVNELPKREQTRWQKLKVSIDRAKQIADEKGMLLPVSLAAKFTDVSKQRIHELMELGTLERVELDGHVYVTESSLIAWCKAPDNKGGRPRTPKSLVECAKKSFEWARDEVKPKRGK